VLIEATMRRPCEENVELGEVVSDQITNQKKEARTTEYLKTFPECPLKGDTMKQYREKRKCKLERGEYPIVGRAMLSGESRKGEIPVTAWPEVKRRRQLPRPQKSEGNN